MTQVFLLTDPSKITSDVVISSTPFTDTFNVVSKNIASIQAHNAWLQVYLIQIIFVIILVEEANIIK